MDMAVIATGGKQYVVTPGKRIRVEKLEGKEGAQIALNEVLLTRDKEKVTVGTPHVKGAKVTVKVVKQARGPKVVGVKMKAKKRHKKYFGHRQSFTELEVENIAKAK